MSLSPRQEEYLASFRAFMDAEVVPFADQFDRQQTLPRSLIERLAGQGYLGALLPGAMGGQDMDWVTLGLLCQEAGRACTSVRNLITVQNMVGHTILRWGSKAQQQRWLEGIATGKIVTGFALTEPHIGSDARHVRASAYLSGEGYVLNGRKKWITFGQIADLFLVFFQEDGQPCAFLVEADRPGLSRQPVRDMMGSRASLLAEVVLEACYVPSGNLVGRAGFGFMPVAISALNLGRYTVAWGCVGLGQACLEASVAYSNEREQFGQPLKDHQLIKRMITDMAVNVRAARLLCLEAGRLQEAADTEAIMTVMMAKYFASQAALNAANDAVQIHGALGVSSDSAVQRYLRDAKIMEIIEGSTQIHQIKIADFMVRS